MKEFINRTSIEILSSWKTGLAIGGLILTLIMSLISVLVETKEVDERIVLGHVVSKKRFTVWTFVVISLLLLGFFAAGLAVWFDVKIQERQKLASKIEEDAKKKSDSTFQVDVADKFERSLKNLALITKQSDDIRKNSEALVFALSPMSLTLSYSITIANDVYNSSFGNLKFASKWYKGNEFKQADSAFKDFIFSPQKLMNFSKDKNNMNLSPSDQDRIVLANLPKYENEDIQFFVTYLKDSVVVNIHTKITDIDIINSDFSGIYSTKDLYGWYFNFIILIDKKVSLKMKECRVYTGANKRERFHFFDLNVFPSYLGGGCQASVKITSQQVEPYYDGP